MSAPTSSRSTAIVGSRRAIWVAPCGRSASGRRSGRSRIPTGSPTSRSWPPPARWTATSISGQQTPTFYAKQVVASLVNYGMSLLPPFFGGLAAYDAEANVAFACPGHQGGQFYRKSPAGQLFFKHFGEQIFRNDLCNADVDLGDLLIHEGAAALAQRHAARVFGADKTYFVLNGTSTSNKVVTQRGAASRRSGPVRPQQPQVAASGRAGPGGRDSRLPPDGAQPVRHDRRRRLGRLGRGGAPGADPDQPAGHGTASGTRRSGPSAWPASSSRPTTARSTTSARCWRRSGTCATTSCGTRPGSATTPSTRCSRTTARCA